jgi:hypothetical protein
MIGYGKKHIDRLILKQDSTGGLDMLGTAISLAIIFGLLILVPPVAAWCSVSRHVPGRAAWFLSGLALIGPFIATFFFVVLLWLPDYSGQCGGWLGETTPCRFGQYATETVFWAAMSIAVPALLGILLGVVVLIVGLNRRDKSRPAS